jgi:cytosine/adenosine deaminase-related metal-dependent hydrolase
MRANHEKHLAVLLCIVSCSLVACRKQETTPAELSILIKNVTVIDPATSSVTPATSVLVTGSRIQAVVPAAQLANTRARIIDGTGKYLIPGLWDMHVHTNMGDWIPGATDVTLPLFVANGVTGIRTMGDELPSILQWRDAIAQGKLLGPRMVSSGPMLDGPKPNFPASVQIATPADAVHAVDNLKSQGVDFIKIQSLIPRNAYFAAAAEARKQGIVFAGHVPDAVRASEAAQAGQKSIEHYTGVFEGCSTIENKLITGPRGPRKSVETFNQARADKLIALFVKDQTWQVPTLVWERGQWLIDKTDLQHEPLDKYVPLYWKQRTYPRFVTSILATLDTDPISFRERYVQMEMEMTAAMHKAGVPFLAGTDTAAGVYVVPGFSLHEEMELFQQAGFTPMEALQTATSNPARFLGTEATMGSVAPGKIADLVLLNADPTADIHNARKIESVVLAGKYFSRADLDNLLLQVQQAALKIR